MTLIIFDCDGVLVDSEIIANKILAEMMTALGAPGIRWQAHQGNATLDIQSAY
jgi:beta-phosphoglucomutase-like phosphatase (HAD superfamily)